MRTTVVYGPAYLDRVLRVNSPLVPGVRIDGSMDGILDSYETTPSLEDRAGCSIALVGLDNTLRPLPMVRVDGLFGGDPLHGHTLQVIADIDDLGGMGSGYAKALNGTLISALGPEDDPIGNLVAALIAKHAIEHRPIRVADQTSDWSLIVSSGAFGDKLAIGFRGCHSSISTINSNSNSKCDLLVVSSLPNRLILEALKHPAKVRLLAPAMRNAEDIEIPLILVAGQIDILSMNRQEWEAMPHRESLRAKTPIVVVTDGPYGCRVGFRSKSGTDETAKFPVFPRKLPPKDTNRAGEAFTSTFVTTLMDAGWTPGPCDLSLIQLAVTRGSAAAALVLDREEFGFASPKEIDEAIRRGCVS
jgi:sugar/nucleoside kinase (ribokinase family)